MFLISQQLKTYSQVLSIARKVERSLEKKSRSQKQIESAKRTFQQMEIEDSVKPIGAPLTNHPPNLLLNRYYAGTAGGQTFIAKLPNSKWILF